MKKPKPGDVLQHPLANHRGRRARARVLAVVGDAALVRYTDTGVSDVVPLKGWRRAPKRRMR